jgi:hypothetical protein
LRDEAFYLDDVKPGFWTHLKERLGLVRGADEEELGATQPLFSAEYAEQRDIYAKLDAHNMGCVSVYGDFGSVEQAESAVASLKEGRQVVVNLEGADRLIAQRIVDIINGASYALNGYRKQIGDKVFLYTPRDVYIVTERGERTEPVPEFLTDEGDFF